jgi:hypothetical protein
VAFQHANNKWWRFLEGLAKHVSSTFIRSSSQRIATDDYTTTITYPIHPITSLGTTPNLKHQLVLLGEGWGLAIYLINVCRFVDR